MGVFPLFQLPAQSSKMRFEEPYGSQGFNLKSAGIIPPGIYQGYTPNVVGSKLFVIPSLARGDSVAVAENLQHYNLTVRTEQQIVLDFAGHTSFPVYVVIRSTYSITPHPFGGVTDAKIMTVTPAQLQPTDIKICRVDAGGPPLVIDVTVPTSRDELGGSLVPSGFRAITFVGEETYTGPAIPGTGAIVYIPTLPNGYLDVSVPSGYTYNVFIHGWTSSWHNHANWGVANFYVSEQIPPLPAPVGDVDKTGCLLQVGSSGGIAVLVQTQGYFYYRTVLGPGPMSARYRLKYTAPSPLSVFHGPASMVAYIQKV